MENIKIRDMYSLEETIAKDLLEKFEYPWEVLPHIKEYIIKLGNSLPEDIYDKKGDDIWIAKSAKVFDSAYIGGPCIIDEEAEVRHCAFIRGSAIVGKRAVVGNSTELKNVILFNKVQVPHYNYVGDSILGYMSHMGAGSITSNVKSDKTLVVIKNGEKLIETGIKKVGAMLADNVEVGCNSVLNPGTVICTDTNIYPTSCVRGVIPPHSIYKEKGVIDHKRG
ncbi:MAG: UDP-N-acetylglucosamine pyrophosphorylase [Lachnospiraceae bacterium]|nr:UDP-N-acetylglucosamine pyrophosphorylase [Lachnospiraceae bacterium]